MHVTLFSNQLIFGSPDLLTTSGRAAARWDGPAPLTWSMNWRVNHMEWFHTHTHTHIYTRSSSNSHTTHQTEHIQQQAVIEHKCLIKWSMHKLGFTFGRDTGKGAAWGTLRGVRWVSCWVLGPCWTVEFSSVRFDSVRSVGWFNKHKMCQHCKIILSPSGANNSNGSSTMSRQASWRRESGDWWRESTTIGYKV